MRIKPVENQILPEVDGSIDLIYGGLGGGKTYAATADILEDLRAGYVVFASWPIDFRGVNQLHSVSALLAGIFGLKSKYRVINADNFHYIPMAEMMDDKFINDIEELINVKLYVDEGYAARLFDSYRKTNMGVRQRLAIYGTRHFNRHIVIVAQRPNAIHVSSRAMVNRFYKCEQPFPWLFKLFRIRFFVKTEYQDMLDESVDETKPLRTKFYLGSSRVYKAYNSKYLRGDKETKYLSHLVDYNVGYFYRWGLLFKALKRGRRLPPAAPSSVSKISTIDRKDLVFKGDNDSI